MYHIDCGVAADPWNGARVLSETPEIDPTALVRASDFGRYTYVGPRSVVAESVLDDYGYAMGDNQIAHARIGKFCNIATGVRINPSNHPWWRATLHHFTYRSRSYGYQVEDDPTVFAWRRQDQVVIGHDVWIGHGVTVMPGVSIGTGAIIGSGSVVTKPVPDFAIVAGVPARLIRFRAEPAVIEGLLELAWWDWSHEVIGAALADFRALTAEQFLDKYRG